MRVTLNSKADKPVALISGSNWNLECWFFAEGGKPENPEKNPRSREENQQQTQPTCGAGTGNRTRATVVGGERSHHYAIPAPPMHFSETWRVAISKTESKQFHQQVSKGNSESILARDVQGKELI